MNDFVDFDNLLLNAERLDGRQLKEWNKTVHNRIAVAHTIDPLEALLDEVLAPRPTWISEANIVMLREMRCSTCDTLEQRCEGWYTVQRHKTDKHARRLIAGKCPTPLPVRVERHQIPAQDICATCAESQVMIEELSHEPKGKA